MDIDGSCLVGLNPLTEPSGRGGRREIEPDQAGEEETMSRPMWRGLWLAFVIVLAAATAWPIPAAAQQEQKAVPDGKVNINTASKAELMKLDGIGPSVAEKIIEYRSSHGPFKKPEDVRKVRGFGKGLWERNKDAITVK